MKIKKFYTRVERILDLPLAKGAIRLWPQSGKLIRGREDINKVESNFENFKMGMGRRAPFGDRRLVEVTCDYGDGRLYRNVTIAEIKNLTY